MLTMTSKSSKPQGSFGRIAVENNFLNVDQLKEGLRLQAKLRSMGIEESLGEILIRNKSLSPENLAEILRIQGERTKTQLPGLKIETKLGGGAMGSVFRAVQLSMSRPVAVKVLKRSLAEDPLFRERFLREARSSAHLSHKNIVGGIDCGVHKGMYFYVMELVEGITAQDALTREGPMSEKRAVELAIDIASGLQYAHDKGYIHRDVKPDNILIESGSGQARLTDLGLARPVANDDANLTAEGTTLGTAYYMSPEQVRGESDLDIRADLYSLGATLFQLVTGEVVFEGKTGSQVLVRHLNEEARDIRAVRPGLSREFAAVIARLLEKNPADRFPTPAHLANELSRFRSGTVSVSSRSKTRRGSSGVRRLKSSTTSAQKRRSRQRGRRQSSGAFGGGILFIVAVLALAIFILMRQQ